MADGNTAIDTSEFDKHFAELAKMGDGADDATSEAPATTPTETPAETAKAPAEEAPAKEVADAPAGTEGVAETGGEPPAPVEDEGATEKPATTDDTLKRFAEYMERQEAERQREAEERAQQEAQARQQQEVQQQPQPELISPQEVELLQTFEKDWPEAAEAMKVALRVNTQLAVNSVLQTIEQYIGPKMHLLDLVANRMQFREMQQEFPQYNDEYRENLKQWALSDEHPAYLRAAHEHVIKNGSQQDVADLISRYEAARGSQQATTPKADTRTRKTPELPTTTIQAARSMAPVSGKRSNPTVQVEPASFDEAFDKFVKEEG